MNRLRELETLESRVCLSVSAVVENGDLIVKGVPGRLRGRSVSKRVTPERGPKAHCSRSPCVLRAARTSCPSLRIWP